MQEKIRKIIKLWSMVNSHVRLRDRSLKTMQYSCQMLLGFYGNTLTKETRDILALIRRTSSTSRKAFWLFKSINHINQCIILYQTKELFNNKIIFFDFMEQFALIFYYFFENIVFLIRIKILNYGENFVDKYVNLSWFIGDFFCAGSAFMKLINTIQDKLYENKQNFIKKNDNNNNENENIYNNIYKKDQELLKLLWKDEDVYSKLLSFIIASLELIVSSDFVGFNKKILGRSLGDTCVGYCGAASSVLILYEGFREYDKQLTKKSD